MDAAQPSPTVGAPIPVTEPGVRRSARPYVIAVVAVVVFALAAFVAILVVSRPTTTYPAGSPETELQAYLAAYQADDLEAAYGHFSSDVRARMSLSQFEGLAGGYRWQDEEGRRIVLAGSNQTANERVTLDVTIEHMTTNVFGASRWSQPLSVRMVKEQGTWRIDDALVGTEPAPYMGP